MPFIEIDSHKILVDAENYLQNPEDWNPHIALYLATQDNLILTPSHFIIFSHLREFYINFHTIPSMRALIQFLKKKEEHALANSISLHQLFPLGVLKYACKYAGLSKPPHCT